MNVLVIPIKPVFAYRIFTGRKKYDLRKLSKNGVPVKTGDRAVLYVTGSVKAFMGEYTVGNVIVGTPEYIVKTL
ncbi:MAG: DNA-binding protein, partial [Desulfurococcaceae archaeon]